MQVRVLLTRQHGDEALVDEHKICILEVVDSSSTTSTSPSDVGSNPTISPYRGGIV